MTVKNYGPAVSGALDPDGRNWETLVYQAAKPVLDKELNLIQDAEQAAALSRIRQTTTSGWITDAFVNSSNPSLLSSVLLVANTVQFKPMVALVNGWVVTVAYTDEATSNNRLSLGAGPSGAGSKRTDLVVLEVWRRLIPAAPSATGKSATGRIWRNGNVKIASGQDVTLNYADDTLDGQVATETTKRVQIQYRLRVINGVDLFTYPFGINDPSVVANSVPAAAASPNGTATAFTYTNQGANGDAGLWRAGDGNPANTLGTVDGYMYAIPLTAVFRRNTTAFDRNSNHNGGVTYPTASDRPDGYRADIIETRDLHDLRMAVSPTGWDLSELLQRNLNYLFDNTNRTEIGATLIGGGVHGNTVLWADEIGITNANGGNGTTTGDTPGAEFIGQFDGIRRTYSDGYVYETVVVKYLPTGGTWDEGETVPVYYSAFPPWPYNPFNWLSYVPANVRVMDVLAATFAGTSGGQITFRDAINNFFITGLGRPLVDIELLLFLNDTEGTNETAGMTVTNEDLYVTYLIAYPLGGGLAKTPAATFADSGSFKKGVVVNNPAQLPATSPVHYSALMDPVFEPANREVSLTYRTVQHSFTFRTGANGVPFFDMPERVDATQPISITVNGSPFGGSITVDSTGYRVTMTPAQTVARTIVITYQAIRPLPQNGEQLTVFYEARVPQMVRDALLPASLTLAPKLASDHLYVLTIGTGAVGGTAYPFPLQSVQSGAIYPGSGGTFTGDHELAGPLNLNLPVMTMDTGFAQLVTHIPAAASPESLVLQRSPGDVDAEGRSYYKSQGGNYAFLVAGMSLSDPRMHKNVYPVLCQLTADTSFGFKGEYVLVLLTRWSSGDTNTVFFNSDLSQNLTAASVFRLSGQLLGNRRG